MVPASPCFYFTVDLSSCKPHGICVLLSLLGGLVDNDSLIFDRLKVCLSSVTEADNDGVVFFFELFVPYNCYSQ